MGDNALKMKTLKENQKEKIINENMFKCLSFFINRYNGIWTEERLKKALSFMSEENRKIFTAKWGLDDGNLCKIYKNLDEKLSIENSKVAYHKALQELDIIIPKMRFAEVFQTYELYEFDLASCYGKLLIDVFILGANIPKLSFTEMKKRCDTALNNLTEKERIILSMVFGLEDGKMQTLKEIGKEFSLTRCRIERIVLEAIEKLRNKETIFYDSIKC